MSTKSGWKVRGSAAGRVSVVHEGKAREGEGWGGVRPVGHDTGIPARRNERD